MQDGSTPDVAFVHYNRPIVQEVSLAGMRYICNTIKTRFNCGACPPVLGYGGSLE